jgi:hypothetical protein
MDDVAPRNVPAPGAGRRTQKMVILANRKAFIGRLILGTAEDGTYMHTSKIPLELITVASPCTAPWDAMNGDDRVRFCGQCSQHVYNLSELTQTQAEDLVQEHEGKMCVRFYRRADGTMLTKDCPVGWRAIQRRVLMIGGAAAAALVVVLGLITASALAAGGRDNRGVRAANPVQRAWDWLFPPPVCVMGEPVPVGPVGGPPPTPPSPPIKN